MHPCNLCSCSAQILTHWISQVSQLGGWGYITYFPPTWLHVVFSSHAAKPVFSSHPLNSLLYGLIHMVWYLADIPVCCLTLNPWGGLSYQMGHPFHLAFVQVVECLWIQVHFSIPKHCAQGIQQHFQDQETLSTCGFNTRTAIAHRN